MISARMILLAMSLSEDPEIGPGVARAFGTVRARLKSVIEAAPADGSMRADVDAETLTWIWHGLLLIGAVRRSIRDDGVATGAVVAARALGALLQP